MAQRKLFDNATLKRLRAHPLYSQDGKGNDAVVSAKIFNPYGGGTIYLTEYDGKDTMYGIFERGGEKEYGYFSKSELENTRVNVYGARLPLERDAYFKPTTVGKISTIRSSRLEPQGFTQQPGGNTNMASGNSVG